MRGNADNPGIVVQGGGSARHVGAMPVIIIAATGAGNEGNITVHLQIGVVKVYPAVNDAYFDAASFIISMDHLGIDAVHPPRQRFLYGIDQPVLLNKRHAGHLLQRGYGTPRDMSGNDRHQVKALAEHSTPSPQVIDNRLLLNKGPVLVKAD